MWATHLIEEPANTQRDEGICLGVNLNSLVSGGKRLLMPDAGIEPSPCIALGPKRHLGTKEKATTGHQAPRTCKVILARPHELSRTNLQFAEPQILVQRPLYHCSIFLHHRLKYLIFEPARRGNFIHKIVHPLGWGIISSLSLLIVSQGQQNIIKRIKRFKMFLTCGYKKEGEKSAVN